MANHEHIAILMRGVENWNRKILIFDPNFVEPPSQALTSPGPTSCLQTSVQQYSNLRTLEMPA